MKASQDLCHELNRNHPIRAQGCGPSISNIISASNLSSDILMADFLKSNRDEVERFVADSEEAFPWDHYFEFVANLEQSSPEILKQRTRDAIRLVRWFKLSKLGEVMSATDLSLASRFSNRLVVFFAPHCAYLTLESPQAAQLLWLILFLSLCAGTEIF